MTVDTLPLAKELRAAELSSTQAEAIVAAIGRAVLEGVATKAENLRATMMMRFIGTILTLAAITTAVAKL